jgi:phosphoribosylanthranilate isomerase
MMVKICGITNAPDAIAAAAGGAGAVGFNFYLKSPRYVTPQEAARIGEQLPRNVIKVGVFVNAAPEELDDLAETAHLDVVQLHGDEPPSAIPQNRRVWKALRVNSTFDPATLEEYRVEAFLLDAGQVGLYGGTGHTFDWRIAAGSKHRIVLAGGLGPENVAEAIRIARPWGVDACSKLESSPGIKDHRKLAQFLEAALSAANQT